MTETEIKEANTRIAESLGRHGPFFYCKSCLEYFEHQQQTGGLCLKCGQDLSYRSEIPFHKDLNASLAMWEVLTEEEKARLIKRYFGTGDRATYGISDCIECIHFALSPEFVEAWCKAKGIL